ncbi:MAG TPA: O-antigen ligase family protein [Gaiellaceae bacterium]|nr:O-antigen ligase family protein [Gaiellaceae bacterium]
MRAEALDLRPTGTRAAMVAGIGAIALVVGLGSVIRPSLALGAVLGAAFLAISFRDLPSGVAIFTVMSFFQSVPGAAAVGLSGVKAAGAVVFLAWLFELATRRAGVPLLAREAPAFTYVLAAFIVWALVSQSWAADGHIALTNALRLAQGPLLIFVVFSAIRTRAHVRMMSWAFVIGALLTAVVGLSGATQSDQSAQAGVDSSRLAGGIGDPNALAAFLVPALAIAAFMLPTTRNPLRRWVLVTVIVIFAFALFQTASRGGIVAFGAVAIVLPFLAGPYRARATAFALAVFGAGVAYFALLAPPAAVAHVTNFSTGGGTGRTDLWSIAVQMFRNHPIGGVGVGNFQFVEPRYALGNLNLTAVSLVIDTPKVAHNTYLHILAELGIVGLALFVAALVIALGAAWRASKVFHRASDPDMEALSRGFLVGTVGLLSAYVFFSAQYEKQLWLVLGVLLALRTVARRETVTSVGDESE